MIRVVYRSFLHGGGRTICIFWLTFPGLDLYRTDHVQQMTTTNTWCRPFRWLPARSMFTSAAPLGIHRARAKKMLDQYTCSMVPCTGLILFKWERGMPLGMEWGPCIRRCPDIWRRPDTRRSEQNAVSRHNKAVSRYKTVELAWRDWEIALITLNE